jgi:tripartite-type tricarboxylate transporter receptor subunit TctC
MREERRSSRTLEETMTTRTTATMVRAFTAMALASASGAWAQTAFPTKPLRMYVGFAPGGFTDLAARLIGPKLSEALGQPVIIENRTGANGGIAAELTARSAPDGHTMYMASPGHTTNPLLQDKTQYDAIKDFTAVSLVAHIPNVFVVHPSVPWRTLKELLAHARARPQAFTQGSAGIGSPGHLSSELLQMMTNTRFVHVPYKGSGPALIDLISGHIDLSFPSTAAALPHVKAGKLRALGVTSAKRSPQYPDVPTIAEAGVPGYDVVGWYGLIGPAGMPDHALTRLSTEIARIVKMPDIRDRIAGAGAEPVGNSPAEFATFLVQDQQKWAKVIKAGNIRAQGRAN